MRGTAVYPFTNIEYVRHVPNYTRAYDVETVDAMPDPDAVRRQPDGRLSASRCAT